MRAYAVSFLLWLTLLAGCAMPARSRAVEQLRPVETMGCDADREFVTVSASSGGEVPMAAAGTWSLATMIFSAMSLLLAIFTIASKSIRRGLKAAAAVALAATGAILLITSDLSGMMVTANEGTLAVVILNIFEAVFANTATNEARLG